MWLVDPEAIRKHQGKAMPHSPTVELPELFGSSRVVPARGGDFTSAPPLRGITVLAVEDSRFACEALRLMCRHLGARLRRADSLRAARSHLRLYRPDVVIIDLGLPDGRGEDLIRELCRKPHAPVVLGLSGDPDGRVLALAAGAQGFVAKPLESISALSTLLLHHLPDRASATPAPAGPLRPDRLALRDDLARAAAMIDQGLQPDEHFYLTGFLAGVAAHAHDNDLAEALGSSFAPDQRLARIKQLLDRFLATPSQAFAPGPAD
jgi:CheY-like chemotaxis protein